MVAGREAHNELNVQNYPLLWKQFAYQTTKSTENLLPDIQD
jgi:hypothetical protein